MAFVITDTCAKDELCVEACPVDSIHPKKHEPRFEERPQLYIDPVACIDCGACIAVCSTESVFVLEDLPPDKARFAVVNAAYYA